MWPLLRGLWKARCGRKVAVAAIAPLVERSRHRLTDIPDSAWLDPYLVGFMVMFITLVARRKVDALDTHALSLVQCNAWGDITGMRSDLIGEETMHLCSTGNKEFERGCRDAIAFDVELYKTAVEPNTDLDFSLRPDGGDPNMSDGSRSADVMIMWEDYFEHRVMAHAAAGGGLRGCSVDPARAVM